MENNKSDVKTPETSNADVIGIVENGQDVNSRTEQEARVRELDEFLMAL